MKDLRKLARKAMQALRGGPATRDHPIAAVTFCWNEATYVRKWVSYYAPLLGRENLYVVAHGGLPEIYAAAQGCNVIALPRRQIDVNKERRRARFVEGLITFLLGDHRAVIFGDVDEFIVADPAIGTLTDMIDSQSKGVASLKTLNLNVLDTPSAGPVDFDQPLFSQRRFARTRYQFCKPTILFEPARFVPGFHYSDHPPVVAEGLYLAHIHYADRATNEAIAQSRLDTFEQMPTLDKMPDRKRNAWVDYMGRYERYNANAADLPVVPLDEIAPKLIRAMRNNIEPGNEKSPADGKTMTYGKMNLKFRIELPDRFAAVF